MTELTTKELQELLKQKNDNLLILSLDCLLLELEMSQESEEE